MPTTRLRIPDWLPLLALPLAMFVALLALGGDRGYFYRYGGFHSPTSAQTLAIVENLSPARGFQLATRAWLDEDGAARYVLYSRFPVGGYALLKLATLPFGDDLAAKLFAARLLALLMFCGAAALAHLAIARITGSRWIALAATLTAFSSFYALYYADSAHSESAMDLFGAALTFHGMTVFVQEGRFRQLLLKTCAALLLGWHVYALLLPFIAIGFGGAAIALLRAAVSSGEKAKAARTALTALARSRWAALAAVSILFGASLLALNLANEYAYFGGERAFSELPTVKSALRRSGQTGLYSENPAYQWDGFLNLQLYRVGSMSIPSAVSPALGYDLPRFSSSAPPFVPAALGLAAACAALAGIFAFARGYRVLMATAVLFGFCWAIPMRANAYDARHGYEALPYLWLALALFAAALIGARRLAGARLANRIAIAAAAIAAPLFALSILHAAQLDRDPYGAERQKTMMEELSAIRETTRGSAVALFPRDTFRERSKNDYYLAGSYMESWFDAADACDPNAADFAVSSYRAEIPNLLTPDNKRVFLYEDIAPLELCRAERRRLESSQPAARAAFDVYLREGAVGYLKAPCAPRDYDAPFYFYIYPVNADDLPARFRQDSFQPTRETLRLEDSGGVFDGVCLMTLRLPDYPISAIRTGQWIPGVERRLWDLTIAAPLDADSLAFYENAYQTIAASGDLAARTGFDLYLNRDANTLSYLKTPCDENAARGRFFLSVHPVDVEDLPEDRREIGHDSLNFTFAPPHGVIFANKCMATRQLPDYEIAEIETGQWIPGGDELWRVGIVVSD